MSDQGSDLPVPIGQTLFARRELYDRVWGRPLSAVAKELGVSDQALIKACRRAAIPTPPRGYWAKLAAGMAMPSLEFVEADPRAKSPLAKKQRPDPTETVSKFPSSLVSRPRPEPPPPISDLPLTEYRFFVTRWDWGYGVGDQGEAWANEASDFDVWPEFEDVTLIGNVVSPERLAGKSIDLFVQPAAPGSRFIYSDLDRAHVGILHLDQSPIVAEVAMPQSAASRLLQVLISGRLCTVKMETEPTEDADAEIIVTIRVDLNSAAPTVSD